MRTLIRDIRYHARVLVQNPVLTVVAVLALSLDIGVHAASFSVVNAIWLRLLPFRDSAGPVAVREKAGFTHRDVISPANYLDGGGRNHVFGDLAAVVDIFPLQLTGSGQPEVLPAGAVSANFFQRIGVQPVIGRSFLPAEGGPGRDHVVILSHQVWRRRFGGDVEILRKSITLSGELYQVIGILPADFSWNNRRTDVWVPYVFYPERPYRSIGGRYISALAVEFVDAADETLLRRRQCV